MDMHNYEDHILDETISQLTSKLPTPPPRPASLASSTRSSKRSSAASSMTNPNTKYFETNASEAPPTPSIAEIYTHGLLPSPVPGVNGGGQSFMSLGDEMALSHSQQSQQQSSARSSIASTSVNQIQRGLGDNVERIPKSKPAMNSVASTSSSVISSNGNNVVPRKRSSKQQLRGDGPSIVIGVRNSQASSTIVESSAIRSRSHSVTDQVKPQRPPRSKRSMDLRQEREKSYSRPSPMPQSRIGRSRRALSSFFLDLIRAALMLWHQVFFPLVAGIVGMLYLSIQGKKELKTRKRKLTLTKVGEEKSDHEGEIGKTFAEKFKFALCTSNLLTTTLSISSYDSSTIPKEGHQSDEKENYDRETIMPTSTFAIEEVRGMLRQNAGGAADAYVSPMELTGKAQMLLKACLASMLLSYPISPSRETWSRSSLLLTSMILGFIAVFGVRTNAPIQFETTHKPTGAYRPSLFDERGYDEERGLSEIQKKRIKAKMQSKLNKFTKACKYFDVECNKALAVVQETELISRGYKITHPLPPISRIELTQSRPTSSPPRSRNGSHPASLLSSRLSTNGRAFNSHLQALSSSNTNGEEMPLEPIRMANVRKSLAYAFEDVNGMIKSAITDLKPLVDSVEMDLLREMYELDDKRRTSIILNNETNDSTLQRGSWTSRAGIALSDSTRPSSSPTNEDYHSSPKTPQNRDSLLDNSLMDKFGSIRKATAENGVWDTPSSVSGTNSVTSGIRPGSRLSYISDKSPTNVTSFTGPNQNGALKRLSYSSAGALSGGVGASATALPYQRSSLQPAPRNLSGHGRRQSNVQSLLSTSGNDDSRPTSPLPVPTAVSPVSPNMVTSIDGYKIISLKGSFEEMHSIRRRMLYCLLALDFSLADKVQIETSSIKSTKTYWSRIGKIMGKLTDQLNEFGENVRSDVEKEIAVKKTDENVQDVPKRDSLGYLIDYSGFQDRLIAMGESLRSVQIKMRLCADELQMRGPPPLHGENSEESSGNRSSTSSEALFATIREDLLQLSAEWEAASKIMRMNGKNKNEEENVVNVTSPSLDSDVNNGNTLHPVHPTTGAGLLLESPQEAEEDAMREWVKNRTAHLTSDMSLEASAIEAGLKQILERAGESSEKGLGMENIIQDDTQESDRKIGEDLSSLLLRSTSPQSLPPPGIATVYEDIVKPAEQRKPSHLSREERIRMMKEQRNVDAQQLASHANKRVSGGEMMSELRNVMKNRQSQIIDGKLQNQMPEKHRSKSRPSTSPTLPYANLEPASSARSADQQLSHQLQRKPATRKYTG